MKPQFIFKSEKKEILKKLEYYGINQLDFLLIHSGNEKIRGYSGSLSTDEIMNLDEAVRIELTGMYLFNTNDKDGGLRLSFDAVHILGNQITKNILELNDEQAKEFLKGGDIALSDKDKEKFKDEPSGLKVVKNKGEFLGTCKLTYERIINYMPKERRLR